MTTENSFKKSLQSANSVEETLQAFKGMEVFFNESDLGSECYFVAEKLFKLHAFDQVICFGEKALTILLRDDENNSSSSVNHDSCLLISRVLLLLGVSCFHLKRYDESLSYLNRANTNLSKFELDNNRGVFETLLDIQMELYNVNEAMGKREEAVVNALKVLEIKEKTMKEGCVELGDANMGVSEAYLRAFDHKGALPFCLKALEIYTKYLGSESLEVAEVRRSLAVIYQYMREYNKAFDLNQLAIVVLKEKTPGSPDLLIAVIEGAYTLVELGRYEEAVDAMKDVVTRDDVNGWLRVKSFLTMAKALCYLGNFADAEKYMTGARRMLEEKEIEDPMLVPIGFSDLSLLYQKRNDLETAISMMKRALALPGLPQKLLLQLCEALMSLISKSGEEKEEVPFIEDEVNKLKVSFDPAHCVVGYGCASLGATYLKSGQTELGATSLANAKDILDTTLGPHHLTSLKISHGLSLAYATLGRYSQALEVEEEVVEGSKGLEPSDLFLHEVVKHLSNMKEKVAESPTRASSQSIDDEDLAEKI